MQIWDHVEVELAFTDTDIIDLLGWHMVCRSGEASGAQQEPRAQDQGRDANASESAQM
jgi:hypothetical protein